MSTPLTRSLARVKAGKGLLAQHRPALALEHLGQAWLALSQADELAGPPWDVALARLLEFEDAVLTALAAPPESG